MLRAVLIIAALTGCTLSDPSQWRPGSHIKMSRNCRVVCYPGTVYQYDAMAGSCRCRSPK
jgi:hypothetical protein